MRTAPAEALDPLLMRLIELLPPPGSVWPMERRAHWLRTFAANMDLVYGHADPPIAVRIKRADDSADGRTEEMTSATPFVCPFCGAVSHNPNDARQKYCAACHCFVDDAERAYRDDSFTERACDRCGKLYRGPAVYCSLACSLADA